MNQISISDIQRHLHKLNDFEILEIIDKKRDKIKGYFLNSKYAFFVQELVKKEEGRKNQRRSLAGSLRKYADPKKITEEDSAWRKNIEERYSR